MRYKSSRKSTILRLEQEQRGEVDKGYAKALLSSPQQSPVPAPSHSSRTERQNHDLVELLKQAVERKPSETCKNGPHLQQPTPDLSSDGNTEVTKNRKRSHTELEEEEDWKRRIKKMQVRRTQRREMSGSTSTQKLDSIINSSRGPGKRDLKISKNRYEQS